MNMETEMLDRLITVKNQMDHLLRFRTWVTHVMM